MGPRRILFYAATAFTVICAFLPLIHSYTLLITALALAGSGLRDVLPAYAHLCTAKYSSAVPALHGRVVRDVRGWSCEHRPIALRLVDRPPLLALDVLEFRRDYTNYGALYLLRDTGFPAPPKSGNAPVLQLFCTAAAGSRCCMAAVDQGERLDWWRSGACHALFFGGLFLLIAATVRRLQGPNPLVDMP